MLSPSSDLPSSTLSNIDSQRKPDAGNQSRSDLAHPQSAAVLISKIQTRIEGFTKALQYYKDNKTETEKLLAELLSKRTAELATAGKPMYSDSKLESNQDVSVTVQQLHQQITSMHQEIAIMKNDKAALQAIIQGKYQSV